MRTLEAGVVDTRHPQSNKLVMGMKIKATGDSKLNDSATQWYQIKNCATTVLSDVLTIQQELILCSAGSDEPHMSPCQEELLQS